MCTLTVNLIDERNDDKLPVPEELLRRVLNEAYKCRGQMNGSVNIMFINDPEMAEMNLAYLNHTGPTDVLAFEDGDIEDNQLILGDIAVSVDTAQRISYKKNMTYENELILYALHGLLHLLGFEDKTPDERKKMEDIQEAEFAKHGLVFNR